MERNTISKILKEEKCYQEKYFDEKVYKITSFEKDINHIKLDKLFINHKIYYKRLKKILKL